MTMLASILFYALIAEKTSYPVGPVPSAFFFGIVIVASCAALACVYIHRTLIAPQQEILRTEPENPAVLQRWRLGSLLLMCFSESLALFGFILRFQGAALSRVVPNAVC
jgi:hypothetical protein